MYGVCMCQQFYLEKEMLQGGLIVMVMATVFVIIIFSLGKKTLISGHKHSW